MTGQTTIIYQGEGMNSSVAVGLASDAVRTFHVSGKVEASSMPHDMRLQRMLGHIPALVHPKPRSVLIVGCGAGVTAGSFVVHPDIERIVICELEPLIPQVVAQYFELENYGVVNDKRVQVVYDDARHYILTTREKFDIITSDPIHPWVKGAATLYTREYFELCKQRLNPGGVISQWVPLYESNMAAVKSELATFFEVFPHGSVWGNDQGGTGYDTVLLGQEDPLLVDVDALLTRLNREDHAKVAKSVQEIGLTTIGELLGTYAASASDLKAWLKDAQINRDRNLRLQYIAGMGSSNYLEAAIYYELLRYRRFPQNVFRGSESLLEDLRKRLSPGGPPGDVP
jgi:spermidine synthase